MNIGEKIQIVRKSKGMSQEDLAQRLLVSRQTVSLWETGKTLPTIDNLVCLKNVFGMTLDDILCQERNERVAGETLEFPLSIEERRNITDAFFLQKLFWRVNMSALAVLLMLAALYLLGVGFVFGIMGGVLLCSLLLVAFGISEWIKAKRLFSGQSESLLYRYLMFDDIMAVEVSGYAWGSENTTVRFDKIEKLFELDDCAFFELGGKLYPISKEAAYRYFPRAKKSDTSLTHTQRAARRDGAVSFYLTVASVVLVALCLREIFKIDAADQLYRDATYPFFCFAAAPLLQMMYGISRVRHQKRGAINIFIGAVFFAVFCFYGSIGLIFRA